MAFKAVAEQTDGDFSLMERTLPPGGRRPPLHRHTNCSEAFFILEGAVTVELEGAAVATSPGDFVRVSRGQAHTFGNAGDTPLASSYSTRLPWTRTSGNCTSWSADEPPSPEQERDLIRRYGMDPA
jgi:mannose-6-phosphate isomerase-like protein (cupin superfamily)